MSKLWLYSLHVIIFNEFHLCQKNEGICWKVVFGCYVRRPLVCFLSTGIDRLEDAVQTSQGHEQRRQSTMPDICPAASQAYKGPKAVGMMLMLEEMAYSQGGMPNGLGKSLTVKTFDVGAAVIVETALLSSCVRKDILLIDLQCVASHACILKQQQKQTDPSFHPPPHPKHTQSLELSQ
jgi:hypothetical protein